VVENAPPVSLTVTAAKLEASRHTLNPETPIVEVRRQRTRLFLLPTRVHEDSRAKLSLVIG
jgi:hypothetical protein